MPNLKNDLRVRLRLSLALQVEKSLLLSPILVLLLHVVSFSPPSTRWPRSLLRLRQILHLLDHHHNWIPLLPKPPRTLSSSLDIPAFRDEEPLEYFF
ncbi:hypothetical protein Scep_029880 [Stephania cephalantha]|uniref:Uncharacterized protein n=1 Tax=Stephania cephalantha TaxID=152367 RepID=A0AAP0E685_9MAGN